jgi:Protein of unknown function (DUF1616)
VNPGPPRDWDRDLIAAVGLALAGVLVSVLPLPDWTKAIFFLLLVLAVPGYAIAAALFPPGFVSRDERAILTLAFSVGAFALAGLLLQIVFDLDRAAWLGLLVAVTVSAAALAQARRRWMPKTGDGVSAPRGAPRPDPRLVVPLLAAVAIATVAIAVGSSGAEDQLARSRFSVLWLIPDGAPSGPVQVATVGVQNHEDGRFDYRLRVSRSGVILKEWRLRLDDGARWQAGLTVPSSAEAPLVAALFRGRALYRRVSLEPEGSP